LPFVSETATTRYYYLAGDSVDMDLQEAFNAWAVQRLGVTVTRKVEYRKYTSRAVMGTYTGRSNTNGFAEPESFTIHTLWSYDNHEVVHLYTSLIGRPSDFFNGGIAVSLQTVPGRNDFVARFNGEVLHDACRAYLRTGVLPLPIARYVTSEGFRSIGDSVMSYRYAGSFVLFLTDRFGLPAILTFFRLSGNGRDDSLAVIQSRFQSVFG
jgi:hypothetical protein